MRSKTVATLHCLAKKEFTALLREHPEVFDNVERMIQASPTPTPRGKLRPSMQHVAHAKHGAQRGREARIAQRSRSSSTVSGAWTTSPCAHAHSYFGHEPPPPPCDVALTQPRKLEAHLGTDLLAEW